MGVACETFLSGKKTPREARFLRRIGSDPQATYADYREFCESRTIGVVANIAIYLIHQTNVVHWR